MNKEQIMNEYAVSKGCKDWEDWDLERFKRSLKRHYIYFEDTFDSFYFCENGVFSVNAIELFEETAEITRFEYITKDGRQVVEYGSFSFDLQDGGKTLKVFKNVERN